VVNNDTHLEKYSVKQMPYSSSLLNHIGVHVEVREALCHVGTK
jgi:hypothetical protein